MNQSCLLHTLVFQQKFYYFFNFYSLHIRVHKSNIWIMMSCISECTILYSFIFISFIYDSQYILGTTHTQMYLCCVLPGLLSLMQVIITYVHIHLKRMNWGNLSLLRSKKAMALNMSMHLCTYYKLKFGTLLILTNLGRWIQTPCQN